jgi:hypothetical protein
LDLVHASTLPLSYTPSIASSGSTWSQWLSSSMTWCDWKMAWISRTL